MYKETIGLIGGFGAYATMNFYRRILEEFASESERNYPHIIMDNNFTMPSRTRALLYGEEYDVIVQEIAVSLQMMIEHHVDKIILICGTAHFFLDDVYKIIPEAEERVVNIIDCLGVKLKQNHIKKALVIAAEGALLKEVYPDKLKKYGISCVSPKQDDYMEIRYFIERVKTNSLNRSDTLRFEKFLDKFQIREVILGCTEFPILIEHEKQYSEETGVFQDYVFWDPLEIVISKLKEELV